MALEKQTLTGGETGAASPTADSADQAGSTPSSQAAGPTEGGRVAARSSCCLPLTATGKTHGKMPWGQWCPELAPTVTRPCDGRLQAGACHRSGLNPAAG